MSLTNKVVLYLNASDSALASGFQGEAEFHFESNFEIRAELAKQALLGNRGQVIGELFSALSDGSDGADGITIDAGQGTDEVTITHEPVVGDDSVWGPVTSQGGSKTTDSALPGAHISPPAFDPETRAYTLKNALRVTRGDSVRDSFELYVGPWSDGTYAASGGRFGEPIPVAPKDCTVTDPEDDPSAAEVSVTLQRTSDVGGIPDIGNIIPDL